MPTSSSTHMTRAELIQQLAFRFPQLTASDVDLSVRTIMGEISRTIAHGGRVEVRGFGSFSAHYRPARVGRNPKTGKAVQVPAKYQPHFKPGKELRERVNAD
jgi:integration host factor subunit beta